MTDRENLPKNPALLTGGCENTKTLSIREDNRGESAKFDADVFQNLRDLLGDACVISSLLDLSSNLDRTFRGPIADNHDRQKIFQQAHYFIARAGIMGFVSLHDTCVVLQNTCTTDASLDHVYDEARAAAIATRNIIGTLIIQTI